MQHEWVLANGFDWQISSDENQHFAELENAAYLGMTIAYGLVNEDIAHVGALQKVAGVISQELGRPIELGPGQIAVPEVDVTIGLGRLSFLVTGRPAVVATAWRRLADVYRTGSFDLTAEPNVESSDPWPAGDAMRFGMTSAAIAHLNLSCPDIIKRSLELLAELNPATTEHRLVFFTNDENLVGTTFSRNPLATPMAKLPLPQTPPQYFGSGIIDDADSQLLFSTMVPASMAGEAAAYMLSEQLVKSLQQRAGRSIEMKLLGIPVGCQTVLYAMTNEPLPSQARQLILSDVIFNAPPAPDSRIESVIHENNIARDARIDRNLRLCGQDSEQLPSANQVRQLLASMRDTTFAADNISPQSEELLPVLNRYPTPEFKSGNGAKIYRSALSAKDRRGQALLADQLLISEHDLACERSYLGPSYRMHSMQVDDLALVLRDTSGWYGFVSNRASVLHVFPAAYRKEKALLSDINSLITKLPVFDIGTSQQHKDLATVVAKAKRKNARMIIGFALVCTLLVLLLLALNGLL